MTSLISNRPGVAGAVLQTQPTRESPMGCLIIAASSDCSTLNLLDQYSVVCIMASENLFLQYIFFMMACDYRVFLGEYLIEMDLICLTSC